MTNLNPVNFPQLGRSNTLPQIGTLDVFATPSGQFVAVDHRGDIIPISSGQFVTRITLADAFPILVRPDLNTIEINGLLSRFNAGQTIVINSSGRGLNDRPFSLQAVENIGLGGVNELSGQETETRIRLVLNEALEPVTVNGSVFIAKEVTIRHGLNDRLYDLVIANTLSGERQTIRSIPLDENSLLLTPETPLLGEYDIKIKT